MKRCGNRKEDSCKTLEICEWTDNKCANRVSSPKLKSLSPSPLKTPPLPVPPEYLQNMNNRHCIYYSDDNTQIEETANMQSSKKEQYDPLFKAPYRHWYKNKL